MPGFQVTTKDDIEPFAEYFDRKVTIEYPVDTPDSQGGFTRTWATLKTSWAHMEPWKGKLPFQYQQQYPVLWERVLLRYRKALNINATMRVHYKSRILYIQWVGVPAEARKVIEILAEEKLAEGTVA